MAWIIVRLNNETGQTVSMSDGKPVGNQRREGDGSCYRMFIDLVGIIDIVDVGSVLHFNNVEYSYQSQANITLTITNTQFMIDSTPTLGSYSPIPQGVSKADVVLFDKQMEINLVPYQDLPPVSRPQTIEDIKRLAPQYFPYTEDNEQVATALWDWTSANFTRIVYFRMFSYTQLQDNLPLDFQTIQKAIWESDWGDYNSSNEAYMNSFMMVPAETENEVEVQLNEKAPDLFINVNAEINLIDAALRGMPRSSTEAVPCLYSGQVDISQLSTANLAAHFEELPANAGPKGTPLQMPLHQARKGFMAVGKTITVKGIIAFSDSAEDAITYSNGILLTVSPQINTKVWKNAAFITPLSSNLDKTEYLFYPGSKFTVKEWKHRPKSVHGRTLIQIDLQAV